MLNKVIAVVLGFVMFSFVPLVMTGAARAGGQNIMLKAKKPKKSVLSSFVLAAQLADYGRSHHDAVALVQAAKIRARLPEQETILKKTHSTGKADSRKKRNSKADTIKSLLAEARRIGDGAAMIEAMVQDVEAMGGKGRMGGIKKVRAVVKAKGTDSYQLAFTGSGAQAEVSVIGDRDSDLDLYVYDESGNVICRDTGQTDITYCAWYPKRTGKFKIKIQNLGKVRNKYSLRTN